jgi:hypothetical protein
MERAGIPLHDAPERYFDQEKWEELVRARGDRAAAVGLVTRPTHDTQFFSLNECAARIRTEFIRRLLNRSLVATGYFRNSDEMATISGPRCRGLQPDFANDLLTGRGETLQDVHIVEAAEARQRCLASDGRTRLGGSRSGAGHEEPGRPNVSRRRAVKLEDTKDAMRADIQQGRLSIDALRRMVEKKLEERYGVSRDTARRARNAVLSESVERQ